MPLSRFDRNFELSILDVIITPPIHVAFSANKSVSGGLNRLTVRIYNLNQTHRLALAKDAEQVKVVPLSFKVGYQDTLQLLFKGTVHTGKNMREGPDMTTELECLDGGFDYLNSFTSKTVRGKSRSVDTLLDDMPNTERGKITSQRPLIRPKVLVGSTAKLIDELVNEGETWYIDDEKLYIIKDDEVTSSFIPVVNAETGLLNTPTRENQKVTFNTLLNPTLRIGGLCKLESTSAPYMNGVYKIESMGYEGDNYGSAWAQSVTGLLAGGYSVL